MSITQSNKTYQQKTSEELTTFGHRVYSRNQTKTTVERKGGIFSVILYHSFLLNVCNYTVYLLHSFTNKPNIFASNRT